MPDPVLLHKDSQDYKVWGHGERNADGETVPEIVKYERFPGTEWKYITPFEAARIIATGQALKQVYIEELNFDDLYMVNVTESPPSPIAEIKNKQKYVLKNIFCNGCLIGSVDFSSVIFDNEVIFHLTNKNLPPPHKKELADMCLWRSQL